MLINKMINELNTSHLHYLSKYESTYYQASDIFLSGTPPNRSTAEQSVKFNYPGIGLLTKADPDGKIFVVGAIEGSPGHRAGVLRGDEIISVDGDPYDDVASFESKIGRSVSILLKRQIANDPFYATIIPDNIQPHALFLNGLIKSARTQIFNGYRIGYVHIWSYADSAYQIAIEELIAYGPLREAHGLIIDLREGWGGAPPQFLDVYGQRSPTLQVIDRLGNSGYINFKWSKPVLLLVNERTTSGKEILAYGFKKYKYGEIVGTKTAGAVLAARAFPIFDEGILVVPVENVIVDGERLEGVGVTPTVLVPFDY